MKKVYNAPQVEKLDFAETACVTETVLSSTGEIETKPSNGDVGKGKGKGGGCDGNPYHDNAKTFSNGRNSGC
ncbi:MAG: hypothetical protein IK014_12075 [Lachnospiraceae bacterium]|nr:hypothetical protein [Lachnospiraceae bacterium]